LIDVNLVCEDAYSKVVEIVTVVGVSEKDRVGNILLQIWKLNFWKLNFYSFFEHKVWSRF